MDVISIFYWHKIGNLIYRFYGPKTSEMPLPYLWLVSRTAGSDENLGGGVQVIQSYRNEQYIVLKFG